MSIKLRTSHCAFDLLYTAIVTSTNVHLFYDVYLIEVLIACVVALASMRCFMFFHLLCFSWIMLHLMLHTFSL